MGDKQCIHYWILDNKDVGRCLHCGAVQDFAVLRGESDKFSKRQAKMVRGFGGQGNQSQSPEHRAKLSAAQKKRWQNPAYRAKMSAARKKRWQDLSIGLR